MIKSIAVIIGGLFVISTTYYLSFWGAFSIDAFQYIQITDIVKGAVYPMRIAGAWYLGAICFVTIAISLAVLAPDIVRFYLPDSIHKLEKKQESAKEQAEREERKYKLRYIFINIILCFLLVVGCVIGWGFINNNNNVIQNFTILFAFISAAYVALCMRAYTKLYNTDKEVTSVLSKTTISIFEKFSLAKIVGESNAKKDKDDDFSVLAVDYLVVTAFVYFVICAIIQGKVDSARIVEGVEYDYINNVLIKVDDEKVRFSKLIYLGTINDKFIFLNGDKGDYNQVIISKDKLPILNICHYCKSDTPVKTDTAKVASPCCRVNEVSR